MGVISTEMVTALGATFRVEPAIGEVATSEFAVAGAAMSKERPSAPKIAAKRFTPLPTFTQTAVEFASMVSLP